MPSAPITVAIVAHHPLDQAALSALVASWTGFRVVRPEAEPPPQVLLLDLEPGRELALPSLDARTAVLLLVGDVPPQELPHDVMGLFSRYDVPESLAAALRQVARGEQYLSPVLLPVMFGAPVAGPARESSDLSSLTERERDILALLGQGLSNKAIAARLYLSVRTVEGHLNQLYRRLGVRSRSGAMLIALHQGTGSRPR